MARRGLCRRVFAVALLLAAGMATAQQVLVRPHQAVMQAGQGLQFEAQLFDQSGRPVRGATYLWSVEPNTLGAITSDGYFVAGQETGAGRVVVVAQSGTLRARGSSEVVIVAGRGAGQVVRLVVEPAVVVLGPGQTQQFRAYIESREGKVPAPAGVRWEVVPQALGTISADGLLTAGSSAVVGEVVAQLVVERRVLRGTAHVAVCPVSNAAITGTVTNGADGSPLVGVVVTAYGLGVMPWCAQDTTVEDGTYRMAVPAPGIYVVRAEAPGFVPEYYDDARSLREASPLNVAPGDTLSRIDFALGRGGAISGLVAAEADSTPLLGAHVHAYLPLLPQVRHHAVTDEEGRYVIQALAAGSYVVEATAPGYQGEFYDNARALREATLVKVEEPETTAGVDFYLASSSAITGCVVDAATGAPIAFARVCAHPALPSRRSDPEAKALTDSSGSYVLAVRPGAYFVEAKAPDYATQWYDGVKERSLATPVVVLADQHTAGVNFHLYRLGALSGVVTDQLSGTPIMGAVVTAYRQGPGAEAAAARTDEHGAYVISGLQPGDYLVRAVAGGYLAEWYPEAATVREASSVAVAAGDTCAGVDFTLSAGGSITGTVNDRHSGEPIAGARVEVTGAAGPFTAVAFTGRDGAYTVTGLPSGSYIVQASARDYVPIYFDGALRRAEATAVVVTAPDTVSRIDFSLPPRLLVGAAISGLVTDERTGEPLRGVRVFALPLSLGQIHRDLTDSTGAYLLRGLLPGRYIVWAFKSGYLAEFYQDAHLWSDATPVAVEAGQQIAGIDFALTPQTRGPFALTGRVIGKDGLLATGAMVLAYQEGELAATAFCNEEGSYILDELPPGRYEIQATSLSGEGEAASIGLVLSSAERLRGGVDLFLISDNSSSPSAASPPQKFALAGAFPNPFNPSTEVRFELPEAAEVSIVVYNVLGQPVRTLLEATLEAGRHAVAWDGTDGQGAQLVSGVYLCRLEARTPSGQRHLFLTKMVLTK